MLVFLLLATYGRGQQQVAERREWQHVAARGRGDIHCGLVFILNCCSLALMMFPSGLRSSAIMSGLLWGDLAQCVQRIGIPQTNEE